MAVMNLVSVAREGESGEWAVVKVSAGSLTYTVRVASESLEGLSAADAKLVIRDALRDMRQDEVDAKTPILGLTGQIDV